MAGISAGNFHLVVTRYGGFLPTHSYDVGGATVQQVPDRLSVQVKYSDANGNVVAYVRGDFYNLPDQTYDKQLPTAAQRAQLARSRP